MRIRHLFSTVFVIAITCTVVSCRDSTPPRFENSWPAMGTFATLTLSGESASKAAFLTTAATGEIANLENLLSIYRSESEISRLNRNVGSGNQTTLSPATLEILNQSKTYYTISKECFDPTVMPLLKLWGLKGGKNPGLPPSADTVMSVKSTTGLGHLVISNAMAHINLQGVSIDLGGIAKGYAVDVCFERLLKLGAKNFMVNLGGNIRCAGLADAKKPWRIGIRNPFNQNELIGTMSFTNGMAVATSGNYEQFVTIAGKKYSHIIDPRTGAPATNMAGVTVVSSSAVEADAMSTSLFILGPEEATPVLHKLPACQALFVPDSIPVEIIITPGLKDIFTPAEGITIRVLSMQTKE